MNNFLNNNPFYLIMKKEVEIAEVVFVILFSIIFFAFLMWASNINFSFIQINNFYFMLIIVSLIWIFYIFYLWKVLQDAKKRTKSKKTKTRRKK